MDVRHLRAIRAIIESGSVGRAAASLNISQPALSKSIQRLEHAFGVDLFVRDSHGMQPTPYGKVLLNYAQSMEITLDQVQADMAALKAGTMGTVTIGASPLTASKVLPAAIARIVTCHPTLKIEIATVATDLVEGLLAGHYDFAVKVLDRDNDPELIRLPLFKDRLLMVSRHDHPLSSRRRFHPRSLTEYPWILPPPGNLHRLSLEQFLSAKGLAPPRALVECSNTGVIIDLVRRTDCLGIIAGVALPDPALEKLRELPCTSPFFVRTIGLVWRRAGKLSPASRLVMHEIERGYPSTTRGASVT